MKRVPILQSGFLGMSDVGLIKTELQSKDDILRNYELGKPVDRDGNSFLYNKDVEDLFKKYSVDHRQIRAFEFREHALHVIKEAFATDRFDHWVKIQVNSPYAGKTHRHFLNDTLQFIESGRRSVNIESWLGLISPREVTVSDRDVEIKIEEYFGIPGRQGLLLPQLNEIIARWTQQVDGFHDLIYFTGIVFSKQSSTTV